MLSLFADAPTQAEQWFAPVLTSIMNVFASFFAYLSSRDRLRFDARVSALEKTHEQCQEEHKVSKAEAKKLRQIVARLGANLQAPVAKKPLPYPDEFGFGLDDDDKEKPEED